MKPSTSLLRSLVVLPSGAAICPSGRIGADGSHAEAHALLVGSMADPAEGLSQGKMAGQRESAKANHIVRRVKGVPSSCSGRVGSGGSSVQVHPRSGESSLTSSSQFYGSYIKKFFYLFVLFVFSSAYAGSYEDFFSAVRGDDGNDITSLIRQGFDANVRDPKGEHALHLATRDNAANAIAALLRWEKIDVEPQNNAGESPLMLASLGGQLDVAKALIARGAAVNKPGWAPLHYAATRGHLDVMRLLLDQHAYIDAVSPNGTTPLMMAAYYGTPTAVKLLLEAGADPMLKNQQQLSAIDFAHRANRADSAEIIAAFVRARQPKGTW